MNIYRYPVLQITPTGVEVVAEHVTWADAVNDAALRDAATDNPIVWHQADDSAGCRDYARTLT